MAPGTGTTADSISDTTVEGEIVSGGLSRGAATSTYEASYKLLLTKTWIATADHTSVYKLGVLDAAVAGNLVAINKFTTAKSVLNGNSITGTVRITFGRG